MQISSRLLSENEGLPLAPQKNAEEKYQGAIYLRYKLGIQGRLRFFQNAQENTEIMFPDTESMSDEEKAKF